jgi:preprotein translocase subunit SecG
VTIDVALNIAIVILTVVLIGLVVLQARSAGLSNRDTSSVYHTKRGLEKTMHQVTIGIAVLFCVLSLIASLPLFGTPPAAPATPPGSILLPLLGI